MNWLLLGNSLGLAAGVTAAAAAAGLIAAVALAVLRGMARALALGGVVVALAIPAFVVVDGWLEWVGTGGLAARWMPAWFRIYSLPGTIWVMALMWWPIPCLAAWSAWQRLTREHLETEPALRGWPLCRWLLWPAARRAVALAAGLVAVLTLNHLAVPAILQVRVLPVEIWVAFNTELDLSRALGRGWPLLAAAGLFLWLAGRPWEWHWARWGREGPAELLRQRLGRAVHGAAVLALVALLVISAAAPLLRLLPKEGLQVVMPVAFSDRAAVINSLLSAVIAATTVTALGAAAGWTRLLAGGRPRPLEFCMWVPFFLPGIMSGMVWIYLLNRPFLELAYRSQAVVWLALAVRYLAVGWFGAWLALQQVDRSLCEAGRMEGLQGRAWWRWVVWPQAGRGLMVVWYIVYLLALWDVESILMVQPPGGETLALRVFNLLHYGHHGLVNALCLWLVGLALLPAALYAAGSFLSRRFKRPVVVPAAMAVLAGVLAGGCERSPSARQAPLNSRFFERVEVIGERGRALGQFSKPRSVAVDRQGNVYAADMTGRVQKFSPTGEFLLSWQMEETDLGKAKGMGRDAEGNIMVVEPHYQRVNHYSPQGLLLKQWGQRGTNVGQFILPRAVAVNPAGDIYVTEYTLVDRVQVFAAADQRLLTAWGRPGQAPGEFNRPEGLAVDRQGRVYVADSCNHRIQIFDGRGQFLRLYGRPGSRPGELSYPYDIQVDDEGFQYVCEFGNSRIQIFDRHDQPVEIIGGPGSAPGRFNNPWALALDAAGNLYVADGNNHRLQKLLRRKGSTPKPP